jgi:peroxiredoxin
MRRPELAWAGVLLIVGGALLVYLRAPRALYVEAGGGIPEIILPVLGSAGPPRSLHATIRGLPAVVVFFDSSEDKDGARIAELERLDANVRPMSVQVVGIAVDPDPAKADAFLKSLGVHFLVLSDPGGRGAREVFRIKRLPEGYIVDQAGRVAAAFPDAIHWVTPEVATAIAQVLPRGVARRVR